METYCELEILKTFYEDDPDPDLDLDVEDDKDDKDDKKDDKLYSQAELDKAAARRQAALKRARKAEDSEKSMKDKLKGLPDPEEHAKLKEGYEDLKTKFKDIQDKQAEAELDLIEDEKKRERIKMEQEFKKEREKLEVQMQKLQGQIDGYAQEKEDNKKVLDTFRKRSLEAEIISAAAAKAYNPQQIVALTRGDFAYDGEDDKWVREIYDSKGKLKDLLSVEEYINAFLEDDINENLLKAGVKRGSDTPRSSRQTDKDDQLPGDTTPTDEMYKWAEMSGLNINKKSPVKDKTWLHNTFTRLHAKPGAGAGGE